MDITNEFVVPLDPSDTWKVLLDIKRIAPCVPGAELLDALDDKTYKGKVSVRLGPITLAFVGTAKFEELDEAAKTAKVLAKGSDTKGRGGANSVVQFRLLPVADGTKVIVETNLNLSGSVAQYGRGAGVIQGVASQLTAQFAQNLKAMLAQQQGADEQEPTLSAASAPATRGPTVGPETTTGPTAIAAPAEPAMASAMPATAASPGGVAAVPLPEPVMIIAALARTEAAADRAEAAAARVEASIGRVEAAVARAEATAAALRNAARPPAAPPAPAKPISGFSLMLTVLWGMITSAFSSKKNG